MRCHFAVMAWGPHVDLLLRIGLPSHLANLTGWPWPVDAMYEVYTTEADAAVIRADPGYARLATLVPTRVVLVDDQVGPSKWATVRYCHQRQVEAADAREAAVFFLCADQLWSRDSFVNAARLLEAGRSAVVCAGPRAALEETLPIVGVGPLSGRDLVRLLLDHPHPETLCWHWDSDNYFQYPTYIYFAVPGRGLVAFGYILHPVAVLPQVRGAAFHHVFDQDWLINACPDIERIHVVTDSDQVCHIELSSVGMELPSQPSNPHLDPVQAMAWYAEATYHPHHQAFAKHPIRLHADDGDSGEWSAVVARGRGIIEQIAGLLELPDGALRYVSPENLTRRINRRNRFGAMSTDEAALLRDAEDIWAARKHRPPWRVKP